MSINIREMTIGKRIMGVDFGLKRVGTATTDELHITVSPKRVFDFSDSHFYDNITGFIKDENVGAVVVGVPLSDANENKNIISKIRAFSKKINELTGKDVFYVDESYTSKEAVKTMIEIGKKKKFRATKGETDKVAAALILREFLSVYENYQEIF